MTFCRAILASLLLAGLLAALPAKAGEPAFALETADIQDIEARDDGFLSFQLGPEAAVRFAAFTASHIGEMVSVTACDQLLTRAIVREEIEGGVVAAGPFAPPAQDAIRDCLGRAE